MWNETIQRFGIAVAVALEHVDDPTEKLAILGLFSLVQKSFDLRLLVSTGILHQIHAIIANRLLDPLATCNDTILTSTCKLWKKITKLVLRNTTNQSDDVRTLLSMTCDRLKYTFSKCLKQVCCFYMLPKNSSHGMKYFSSMNFNSF